MEKKLEIVIVEDDRSECEELIREIDNAPDEFRLVGSTNNSAQAFKLVTETLPDALILDLELHRGGGDGLELLKRMKDAQLPRAPFVLVTTNNISAITHDAARSLGADFIMTKNQSGYSARSVLDFLKITKSSILGRHGRSSAPDDVSPTETAMRVRRRMCAELDKVGISAKSVGYKYLIDAITATMEAPVQHVGNMLGEKYRKTEASVMRAMQNSINRAWSTSDIQDLLDNYTAKIKSDKGVPTVTEFIYFYAQKIKNEL